jgi:hypothetical protein
MGWFMVTLRRIARPLSAVNGLRTTGHAAHGLFRAFVVVDYSTKSVWPPYSYIPYNSLARGKQIDKPLLLLECGFNSILYQEVEEFYIYDTYA